MEEITAPTIEWVGWGILPRSDWFRMLIMEDAPVTATPACGYHGALLWINLSSRTWSMERRSEEFFRQYPGGGLLATRLLLERTAPGIDPLGRDNLLIFASSVLAGHPAAGLPRFTVAGKSPLTNGIGETRTEGPWGVELKASGADAIIFTGASEQPVAVLIEDGKVEFGDARDLWARILLIIRAQ